MAVTLDAPARRAVHGPIWRVGCDMCPDRLYLAAYSAKVAAQRAEREYGWQRVWATVRCRRHREAVP